MRKLLNPELTGQAIADQILDALSNVQTDPSPGTLRLELLFTDGTLSYDPVDISKVDTRINWLRINRGLFEHEDKTVSPAHCEFAVSEEPLSDTFVLVLGATATAA